MSMGSKEDQRERAIRLLAATLLEKGLAETSLRQLAKAAGVSDRMILYYFKDKADILASTLSRIALEMTVLLTDAIPENANLPPVDFIAAATAVTQAPVMRPYMRLWIEIIAVAARGEQPYSAVANQVTTGFLGWIETRLAGEASETKRATAAMIFAMIDGLAILDMCAGEGQSAMAARAFKALRFA
jgi:AcrR family transcriptional regulator